MTNNCLNCNKLCPPSNSNRQRKYCSRKCANQYLQKTKHYGCSKSATDLSKKKAQKLLNVSREMFNEIIETYNIKLEKTVTSKSTYLTQETFQYIKNNLEKFKQELRPASIPHGWDGYEDIANKLGKKYSNSGTASNSIMSIFTRYGEPGESRNIILSKPGAESTAPTKIWQSTDVDKWVEHYKQKKQEEAIQLEAQKKETALRQKLKNKKQETRNSILLARVRQNKKILKRINFLAEELEFKKQTKGLITTEEAVALIGYKSNGPLLRNTDKLPSTKKIKNKYYYKPSEIIELKKYLKKQKREQQKQSQKNKEKRNPRLGKDWTTDEVYEKRLWKRVQKGLPTNLTDTKDIQRWRNNLRLMKNGQSGLIKEFNCSTCNNTLPYTSFYFDAKRGSKYGREGRCKACMKARKDGKEIVKKPKTASQFATQFATAIKQELARQNGHYVEIGNREIWEGVEKHCGYTKEDFIANIKSKFKSWMTWENNGRPTEPGVPTWQLDHIVPRIKFKYTTMADPEFAECWSLDNLEPLESQINLLKSDMSLAEMCRSTFLNGIKNCEYNGGIWQFLDYTPLEARQYLEEDWGERIDWNNLKESKLEIDHIIPQAYLAFTSFEDENFRECWSLTNLQVLTKEDNSHKNSVYKDIQWQYNKL